MAVTRVVRSPHLLHAGDNLRRIKENLRGVVDDAAVDAIEAAIRQNVKELYVLARRDFAFARRLSAVHWRHCISRLYYAAFCAARAVKLEVDGEYSASVGEHDNVWKRLPKRFPDRDRFANRLAILRSDRNICDYDHTARARDLIIGRADSLALVEDFLKDVKVFLISRGLIL